MSPRAASLPRARAVSILREILERGARATPLLSERSAGLSVEDANLLRELVLGVLRWKSGLDAELASACRLPLSRLAPNLREILEVALYQICHLDRVPDYAAVDEAVRHARERGGERAAKLVNAVLRNLLRCPAPLPSSFARHAAKELRGEGRTQETRSLALHFSHPEFLVARWIERFSLESARTILEADNASSPVDLMTNPRKTDRDSLAASLRSEGIDTSPSPLAPLALIVLAGNPFRSSLFAAGHFTVQDVGSQALPLLIPSGKTLLDLAAAPGGKSFAAVALGRVQRAMAFDRSVARLRMLAENRARLDIPEVTAAAADVLAPPLVPGRFDRVLFDAPCSGTGTLRKNPEIRYRVTPDAIDRLAKAQLAGLLSAARQLAAGGYLLYSTCSLEREENEVVIAAALAADSSLERASIQAPEGLASFVAGARFQILPSAVSDGFTAHLLRRKP